MNKIIISGLLILLVSGCATRSGPAPVEESEVESRIRQAARDDSDGVQVFPLRNPAVEELMASASQAEQAGEADRAAMMLERALRIQPRDPELLQQALSEILFPPSLPLVECRLNKEAPDTLQPSQIECRAISIRM